MLQSINISYQMWQFHIVTYSSMISSKQMFWLCTASLKRHVFAILNCKLKWNVLILSFHPNHIHWHFRTSLSKLVISHSINSPNEALGCGDSPLLLNGPTTNKNINKWYSLCCTPPYSKLKNASWITTTKIRFFHAHVKQGYWKCSTRLLRSYIFFCTSFKIRDLVFFPSFIYACVSYLLLLVVLLVQELLFFLMVLKF